MELKTTDNFGMHRFGPDQVFKAFKDARCVPSL